MLLSCFSCFQMGFADPLRMRCFVLPLERLERQKQRGTNMMPKKAKKKKGKKKKGAAAAPAPAPAPAPALARAPTPAPAPAPAPATYYSAPSTSSEMDHSVIKKWVLEVAARRTLATSAEIKRYFHGRVEEGV